MVEKPETRATAQMDSNIPDLEASLIIILGCGSDLAANNYEYRGRKSATDIYLHTHYFQAAKILD